MGVKKRNMLAQVFLAIITLGIYCIYWYYSTCLECTQLAGDRETRPLVLTALLITGFFLMILSAWSIDTNVQLAIGFFFSYLALLVYAIYEYSRLYEAASSDKFSRWLLLFLWIVFSPAVWFIVQTELNKRATY